MRSAVAHAVSRTFVDAGPEHPLAKALAFRLPPGRWPDPMEFVDPAPEMVTRMQVDYPATCFVLRVGPSQAPNRGGGFYRRWCPRTPWRDDDLVGRLVLIEIAQTLLANIYAGVIRAEAQHGGYVKPTCWQVSCPVHPTGLCRFWDAIPGDYKECEYLQSMPSVLAHAIDGGPPPMIRADASASSS
jgi:hypothetical protein